MPKKIVQNILLVDANGSRRNNLSSRLRSQGYTADISTGGFQAIHMIEEDQDGPKSIKLVFLIGDSEDMPGHEIATLIRTRVPEKEKLPILFMHSEEDPAELAYYLNDIKVNVYLKETDNFSIILDKIKQFIDLKK